MVTGYVVLSLDFEAGREGRISLEAQLQRLIPDNVKAMSFYYGTGWREMVQTLFCELVGLNRHYRLEVRTVPDDWGGLDQAFCGLDFVISSLREDRQSGYVLLKAGFSEQTWLSA